MAERRVIEEFIAFVNSAGLDREELGAVSEALSKNMAADTSDFFKQLHGISELAPFIKGPAHAAKLQQALVAHLKAVFAPELAENFANNSYNVGAAHAQVGVPASWYTLTYGWFLMRLIGPLIARHRFRPQQLERALKSMISRMFLDMACSVQAYEKGVLSKHGESVQLEDDIHSLKTLSTIVRDVNDVAYDLARLSKNTYEGVAQGQEIASESEKFFASTFDISRSTDAVVEEASNANDCSLRGRAEVRHATDAMQSVVQAVEETARRLDDLSKASEQIEHVLTLTDGIARQTNLLALNATIEAARAGPAGAGFAIVAHEVKRLAEQSAKATEEISKRVKAMQSSTGLIMETMTQTHDAVDAGTRSVEQAAGTMDEISQRIGAVAQRMTEITGYLGEQARISYAVARCVDRVSSTTNESDERLLAAADKLSSGNARFMESAQNLLHKDTPRSLCEITKVDHVLLAKRVVDVLMGHDIWPAAEIPDHSACPYTQWMNTMVPQEIRALPVFHQLEEPHRRVHLHAKKALIAHEASDRVAALNSLSELQEANADFFNALDALSAALKEREGRKPRSHAAA